MPRIFCILVLTVAALSVEAANAFAQDEALSSYKNGKMVEITDLVGRDGQENCSVESARRYGGTVSAVQFTSGLQIGSFTLRTGKANIKIHISPTLYEGRISKQDIAALPTLIAKGRRITVDTYRCGGAKKIITALYILTGIHMETLG